MISPRMVYLLQEAAAGLREGVAPLSHEFLLKHDVTLDEAYALATWMADLISFGIKADANPLLQGLMARSVVEDRS